MANIVDLKTKDGINMSVLKIDNNAIKIFDSTSGQYVPSVSQGTGTTIVQKKIYPSFTFPIQFDKNKYGIQNKKIYPIDTRQSMPLTLNTQFSGFGQNEKIKRACLLYLNKNGRWIIMVNINNPKQNIVSNSGETKTPFGTNCLKQSYGYKPVQILYILTYYQSDNFSTHDLKSLLIKKVDDPSKIQGAIAIGIVENVRPK